MRLLHILSVSVFFLLPRMASANYIPEYEQQLFIETWANLAVEQMRLYGIPASITMAQAIVESGWGKGYVALGGNNYFCIKSNNGWEGPIVKAKDDDLDSSSFRKYENIGESFTDHSKFLRENRRYQPLFELEATDYKAWAYGLKSCGYATKEDYAEQLIATIEKYGLYLFDYAVPADNIKSLNLGFEQVDEPMFPPIHSSSFEPQIIDNQKNNSNTIDGDQELLPAPRYHLGTESTPSASSSPVLETPEAKTFMQIPLILPKTSPRLQRR